MKISTKTDPTRTSHLEHPDRFLCRWDLSRDDQDVPGRSAAFFAEAGRKGIPKRAKGLLFFRRFNVCSHKAPKPVFPETTRAYQDGPPCSEDGVKYPAFLRCDGKG